MAALPVVPPAGAAEPSGSAVSAAVDVTSEVASSASASPAAVPSDESLDDVQLDANKLHVYNVALELHTLCSILVAPLNRIVRDQLERASLSVVLNTAEAAGRHSRREKSRFYAIARGSATEVAALLDVLERRRLTSAASIRTARRLAVRCVQMLTRIHQKLVAA